MSVLKLQDLEPATTAYGAAALSISSSTIKCCDGSEVER